MSDDDRMDRAERIREMREGRRPGTDEGEDADSADSPESTPEAAATDEAASDMASPDEAATDAAPTDDAATDQAGADEAPPAANPTEESADAARLAEVNEAVSAAVERVSGASAEIPGPDEVDDVDEAALAAAQEAEIPDDVDPESPAEVGAAARAGIAADASGGEPETRVLEFTLDDEQYCLDIEYIEEIVKRAGITRVPNTAEFVEGVVDLRGQITTILNPKVIIGTEDQSPGDLLVVFDSEEFDEQGHIGWVVDDVRQVSPVADEDVNEPPVEGDHIEGVIDRGDDADFVVWTSPELALDGAT